MKNNWDLPANHSIEKLEKKVLWIGIFISIVVALLQAISLAAGAYYIIKKAVKNGTKEAVEELNMEQADDELEEALDNAEQEQLSKEEQAE